MARPVSAAAAKNLIQKHRALLTELEQAAPRQESRAEEVRAAAGAMVTRETLALLRDIPLEELNRGRQGIRLKPLRDQGYETIGELYGIPARKLETISGISPEGAQAIRREANAIAAEAKKSVRIRLSADDRNEKAATLVAALCGFIKGAKPTARCETLLAHKPDLERAIANLTPTTGTVKWFFASAAAKERALSAYEYLSSMLAGVYGRETAGTLEALQAPNSIRSAAWEDFSKNPIPYFTALEELCPGLLESEDDVYGLPGELADAVAEQEFSTEGLHCTLRRYQAWGVRYILRQERVLLGDEMGLGKTVQAIAAMVALKNTGETHFLVICPASVLTNWCREIQKHSILKAFRVHGDGRDTALALWLREGGVAVTTYETTGLIALPEDFLFAMAVVDEAHYIKNPEAKRTKHTKALCEHAMRLLFMTGTALENRVEEMLELIAILQPKIARKLQTVSYLSAAPRFREQIAPVYYRRRREDVLTELPELIETMDWCTMTPEEETVYEKAVLQKRYAEARRVSWSVDDLAKSSKAQRLLDIVEDAEEDGRKIIVFSFFLDTVEKVFRLLGERCMPPITGSIPPARRQEILDEFEAAPAGAVLVAQIQSGGTGLNIQTASVVVLCEPQFKPSIENQAISRAYRMGQARNVLVHRLLCEDSVDEKITALLEEKQTLFDAFADESAAALESLELDQNTFGNILQEEIDRISRKNGILSETPQLIL